MTDAPETTAYRPPQPFLAEHKRSPTVRRDGLKAWLEDEIAYLESVDLTVFGNGSLSALKRVWEEVFNAE